MKRPRIALLGGTFDPIHHGHLMLVREAARQANLQKVVLIPCFQSPHKAKAPIATAQQRLAMATLAAASVHEVSVEVSSWEIDRPEPSYSWQTCQYFQGRHPDAELCWILGEDQWAALPRWSRPEFLAELLTFLVFTREGKIPQAQPPFRCEQITGEMAVSSTQIRQQLKTGVAPDPAFPVAVLEYAGTLGIYR
jgi:nicotinate-nucleotide adenylyltransferase